MDSGIHESRFLLSDFHASRTNFSAHHASRINPLPPSLEAKYYDFVDEEEEARSSSGVLILALGCDISVTLEPLLKQNLCPGFTFQIDPHQIPNSETPPFWMRRENR